jgi:ribosomal protein S27E
MVQQIKDEEEEPEKPEPNEWNVNSEASRGRVNVFGIDVPISKNEFAVVKCPKCNTSNDVSSAVRPVMIDCVKCGAKLRVNK